MRDRVLPDDLVGTRAAGFANLGLAYFNQGVDLGRSVLSFEKALHHYEQLSDQRGGATARLNLDYTQIRAPFSGKASRAEVTVGNLVEAGGSAPVLTSVVSSDPLYADFEIDENSFLRYVAADAADGNVSRIPVMMGLATETDAPHQGHIESFDNRLNTASGTIRVRAVFGNPNGTLVPGLFARIRLGNAGESRVILITDRAVGTDQNKKFVYVVGADNKVEYREVKLGAEVDNLRVVEDGLKPGDKIIVNGLQRAHPGAPVTPQVVDMDGQESGNGKQDTGTQDTSNAKH